MHTACVWSVKLPFAEYSVVKYLSRLRPEPGLGRSRVLPRSAPSRLACARLPGPHVAEGDVNNAAFQRPSNQRGEPGTLGPPTSQHRPAADAKQTKWRIPGSNR